MEVTDCSLNIQYARSDSAQGFQAVLAQSIISMHIFAIFDEDLALCSFGTRNSGGVVTYANIAAFQSSFFALEQRDMSTHKDQSGVTLSPLTLRALFALAQAVFELSSLPVEVVVSGRSDVVGRKELKFDHFFLVVSMAIHRQARHDCHTGVFVFLRIEGHGCSLRRNRASVAFVTALPLGMSSIQYCLIR